MFLLRMKCNPRGILARAVEVGYDEHQDPEFIGYSERSLGTIGNLRGCYIERVLPDNWRTCD